MPTIQRNKTEILSISLPKNLRRQVTLLARENDITTSQYVKQILKGAIFMAEWSKARKAFLPAAAKLGIKTDEDVEKYFG